MADRNNVQLAIGYGLGMGMALAGVLIVLGRQVLSFFGVPVGVLALGAVVVIGGVAIAVLNALKLDREAVAEVEDPPE